MAEPEPEQEVPAPTWRRRLLWGVVALLYLSVLLTYAIPQDLRIESSAHARVAWLATLFFAGQYHLGVFLVVLCGAAAWDRHWRSAAALAPLIFLCLIPEAWQLRPRTPPTLRGESITLLSCNLYWACEDTAPIAKEILDRDADLVLLQEYSNHWHEALEPQLSLRYPHRITVPRENPFGLAVYSKRPVAPDSTRWFPTGTVAVPQVRFELELNGQRVAVYNVHLVPPSTAWYHEHRRAVADVIEAASAERLPTVLAGDFNFSRRSPFRQAIAERGFRDSFSEAGWGRGATWRGVGLPLGGLRLDYVFTRGLAASECTVGAGRGSDHRPVFARIGFPAQN